MVMLPALATSIPDDAFNGCKELKEINIPDTITIIGNNTSIKNYSIASNEKIKANTHLGDTNDSNSGLGESGQKL